MGTTWRIVIEASEAEEKTASAAAEAAFARIAELDRAMSDYDASSELMRLCRADRDESVAVSEELFEVLAASEGFHRLSGGAFDVTVGPMTKLWRRSYRTGELPTAARIEAARALVGASHVHLDRMTRTVRLDLEGMSLDLGGIAKGYAADHALRVLKGRGFPAAIVDGGGDLAIGDAPHGQPGWIVGVQPEGPSRGKRQTVILSRCAIATSGDAHRFVEIGGDRYSHIVDPETGLGLRESFGVTVIAPDGMTADALATAISVAGPDRGFEFATTVPGVEALAIRVQDGVMETRSTSAFPPLHEVVPPTVQPAKVPGTVFRRKRLPGTRKRMPGTY